MLSLVLSWLFRLAFLLMLLFGIVELFVQVRQQPIVFNRSENSYSWLGGEPGISFRVHRSVTSERSAPDTMIEYQVRSAPEYQITSSGQLSSSRHFYNSSIARLDSLKRFWKSRGDSFSLDTQVNIIRAMDFSGSEEKGSLSSSSFERLADGKIVCERILYNDSGKPVGKLQRDTFPDMGAAKVFQVTEKKSDSYRYIEEGSAEEKIRVQPTSRTQHFLFVLYQALHLFFACWLLFMLSRLFRRFYAHEYFTMQNVKLVRNIGLCLLVPQLLQTAFYWSFLAKINLVKILLKGAEEVKTTASYQFLSGTDWTYVYLGLGLLTLSYIFKNGVLLKQENAAII